MPEPVPVQAGADAYSLFCANQALSLLQSARMMKVTILCAAAQNELPPFVRAKLFEEFIAMAGMVEVKAEGQV